MYIYIYKYILKRSASNKYTLNKEVYVLMIYIAHRVNWNRESL